MLVWALWRKWCSLIMLDNAAWEFLFTPPSSIATASSHNWQQSRDAVWGNCIHSQQMVFLKMRINEWTLNIWICSILHMQLLFKQWHYDLVLRWVGFKLYVLWGEYKKKLKIIIELSYVCKMRVKWALLLENSSWWNDGIYLLSLQYTEKHTFYVVG